MKILLTNDDGINAPGMQALVQSVRGAIETYRDADATEIIVVAPDRCRSECGHSLETSRQLSVKSIRPDWHSVDGTPVDCVRVALFAIGFQPDVVFSGINSGANLGINLMVSGTFAAAREASIWGVPSMAVSHYRHPDVPRTWDHTPTWLQSIIHDFFADAFKTPSTSEAAPTTPLWNVNLPAVPATEHEIPPRVICDLDRRPITRTGNVEDSGQVKFTLDYHGRPRESGRDVDQCFGGKITVSKLAPLGAV